jgi:hypothetical protein
VTSRAILLLITLALAVMFVLMLEILTGTFHHA